MPLAVIGAFAGLWMVGFSINTLTLFAIVLATGIVVDDAIVVIENIERHIQEGKRDAFEAAVRQGNVQVITGCIGEIGMACEQDHVRCRSPALTRLQGARAGCPSATYWC